MFGEAASFVCSTTVSASTNKVGMPTSAEFANRSLAARRRLVTGRPFRQNDDVYSALNELNEVA